MKMLRTVFFSAATILVFLTCSLTTVGQTPIQLFGSTFVRASSTGTTTANPVTFNSATVNLTCPSSGITAVLSSTPDGSGHPLVDNFIQVIVTAGSTKSRAHECMPRRNVRGGTERDPDELLQLDVPKRRAEFDWREHGHGHFCCDREALRRSISAVCSWQERSKLPSSSLIQVL